MIMMMTMEQGKPDAPSSAEAYLRTAFGEHLKACETAFTALARAYATPQALDEAGYDLYLEFRPNSDDGSTRVGWGERGALSLAQVYRMADRVALAQA